MLLIRIIIIIIIFIIIIIISIMIISEVWPIFPNDPFLLVWPR